MGCSGLQNPESEWFTGEFGAATSAKRRGSLPTYAFLLGGEAAKGKIASKNIVAPHVSSQAIEFIEVHRQAQAYRTLDYTGLIFRSIRASTSLDIAVLLENKTN